MSAQLDHIQSLQSWLENDPSLSTEEQDILRESAAMLNRMRQALELIASKESDNGSGMLHSLDIHKIAKLGLVTGELATV